MGSASLVPRSSLKSRRETGALHDRYLLLHGERPYCIKNGIPYCRMYSPATDKTSMTEVQMVPSCVGQSALLLSSCIHFQQESCFYFEPGTQVCTQLHVQGMLFLTWENCDVSCDRRDVANELRENLNQFCLLLALFPGSSPAFVTYCTNTGREPGRSHHMFNDILCIVLCVVLAIELLPMHSCFGHVPVQPCWVTLFTVTVLGATQYGKESPTGHNKQLEPHLPAKTWQQLRYTWPCTLILL